MPDEIKQIALSDYPPTLQNMKSPPPKLYVRGDFPGPADQKYLCVIGSRRWTGYGRDAVNKIISGLQGYPISIVSGLAIGIDSIAHMAALNAGLHCVAFPGSSLDWDKIYPSSHRNLARRIVDSGGALVSRWRPDYPMGKWAFPSRNVLMAGLSHATLIVEAGPRSGSLMTAKHAEDFHREIFAIPGSIHSAQSYGPHMLIKNGAAIISSSEDLLEELGFPVSRSKNTKGRNNARRRNLDTISSNIMSVLTREEMSVDMLIDRTKLSAAVLNEKISLLELEGLVRVEDGLLKLA